MVFDPGRTLERDPPCFQPDEHAFGGYHGTFLRAEGATAYEDEYLSLVSQRCMYEILLWKLCTIIGNRGMQGYMLVPCCDICTATPGATEYLHTC